MSLEPYRARLTGVSPLIMHNIQLADPMNEFVKKMKPLQDKKSKRTDVETVAMWRLEFLGSLYLAGQNGTSLPCIPVDAIQKCLIEGARVSKVGKAFEAGVFANSDSLLVYDGPKDLEALWNDMNFRHLKFVRVGSSRVQRMRPIFRRWSTEIELLFSPDVIKNRDQITQALENAGVLKGLLERRPKYGRFTVEVLKSK